MGNATPTRASVLTGVEVLGPMRPGYDEILTPDALAFVADLVRRYRNRVGMALARRVSRRDSILSGEPLTFPRETRTIRSSGWTVSELPHDLCKRMVEITGPVDRKMVINALNSGADTFMADFEDSSAPTWDNMIQGQINLRDAVRRTIRHRDPRTGKSYRLAAYPAVLLVRPRGLHLVERHLEVDGRPVPASLFDFGLYLFHNSRQLLARGTGPYFYLPKLECYREARLWNDVFVHAQESLGIPRSTIKATVLIETLPAAFQMDEILHELREHAAGLNCGRWDYIFSYIKTLRHDANAVLPDRSQVTMEQPFLRAYTQLAVKTCHRRGAHCIGGMAAQIPIKSDPEANRQAMDWVRADKRREARDGHDGTWVAHPALVPLAREEFESRVNGTGNQLEVTREDVEVNAADLLQTPEGSRTVAGLRLNVRVGIRYLESWLGGSGCVPLYHLMEDAATAEISRAQIWQWIRHGAELDDGRAVTRELVDSVIDEELDVIANEVGEDRFRAGRFANARDLFRTLCAADHLEEFLTLPAYDMLRNGHDNGTNDNGNHRA